MSSLLQTDFKFPLFISTKSLKVPVVIIIEPTKAVNMACNTSKFDVIFDKILQVFPANEGLDNSKIIPKPNRNDRLNLQDEVGRAD